MGHELEKYFEEHKLDEFVGRYIEVFQKIDYIKDLFINGILITPEETDRVMKELMGYYMTLNTAATMAETYASLLESNLASRLRLEDKNLSPTAIKNEAKTKSADYRKVANVLKAYLDSCDKAISVCQSSLKWIERERKFPHE